MSTTASSRTCEDCRANIDDRHSRAKLCEPCVHARRLASQKTWREKNGAPTGARCTTQYDDLVKAKALAMRRRGLKLREIAEKLDLPLSTVSNWTGGPAVSRVLRDKRDAGIVEFITSGHKRAEAATKFEVSTGTVKAALHAAGIKLPAGRPADPEREDRDSLILGLRREGRTQRAIAELLRVPVEVVKHAERRARERERAARAA